MQKYGFIPHMPNDWTWLPDFAKNGYRPERKDNSWPKNSCSWSALALSPSFYWISSLWLGSDQKLFPCWGSFDQVLKVSSLTMRVGRISWIFGPSTEYDINSNQLTGSGPFILSITAKMNAGQIKTLQCCDVVTSNRPLFVFPFKTRLQNITRLSRCQFWIQYYYKQSNKLYIQKIGVLPTIK